MNLGEFRRATAGLPDDTEVFIDLGDLEWMECSTGVKLPPVLDNPFCISLEAGQVQNYEYDIDDRIDGLHLHGGGRDWEE